MAIPIKAIPTLIGEDAIRFREEMEANEQDLQRAFYKHMHEKATEDFSFETLNTRLMYCDLLAE